MDIWSVHEKSLSITDLDTADVFRALFNAASPRGVSFLDYDPGTMNKEDACVLADSGITSFDEWKGRGLNFDIIEKEGEKRINVEGYDAHNGEGTAELVIAELRATKRADTAYIREIHERMTLAAANFVKRRMKENPLQVVYFERFNGEAEVCLGIENVKGLKSKIDTVVEQIKAARLNRAIEDMKTDATVCK